MIVPNPGSGHVSVLRNTRSIYRNFLIIPAFICKSNIFLAIINDSLISNRKPWCPVYANFRNFYDFRKFLGSIQLYLPSSHKNSRVLILFINEIVIDIIVYTYFYIYLSIFIYLLVKLIANITNRTSHILIIISRESYHKKI